MTIRSVALLACALCAAVACDATRPEADRVATVEITPADATLRNIGDTLRLTAIAKDSGGTVLRGTEFTWTCNDTTKARVSTDGLVTAVAGGTATVMAWVGTTAGAATIQVVRIASVVVTPAAMNLLAIGDTLRLTAIARDSAGFVLAPRAFSWTSGDTTIARVSTAGHVTAVGFGTTLVTATAGGVSGSTTVTVGQSARIVIIATVNPTLFALGDTLRLAARAYLGEYLPEVTVPLAWSSSDTSSVRVSSEGRVTAVGVGSATVVASAPGGAFGSTMVRVTRRVGNLVYQAIDAGASHACGITAGGAAYCWGANDAGQLGDGTTTRRMSPVAVGGGLAFQAIDAGSAHTCGLTAGGTAYCWGANASGQLGDGTTTNRPRPVAVAGGLTFTRMSAGGLHTCAVTGDGAAHCWGAGADGQLGDSTTGSGNLRDHPVAVRGGLTFEAISAGNQHTCGLGMDGLAYCWGYHWDGQLGIGWDASLVWRRSTPTAVAGGLTFSAISAGSLHTCALTTGGGAAYCWGRGMDGQLGVAVAGSCTDSFMRQYGIGCSYTPVGVAGAVTIQNLGVGGHHTCGVGSDGSAYCWGGNYAGQVGMSVDRCYQSLRWGDFRDCSKTPRSVASGLRFGSAGAGDAFTCGLTTDGAAYCWGENTAGQLGIGQTHEGAPRGAPFAFPPPP